MKNNIAKKDENEPETVAEASHRVGGHKRPPAERHTTKEREHP